MKFGVGERGARDTTFGDDCLSYYVVYHQSKKWVRLMFVVVIFHQELRRHRLHILSSSREYITRNSENNLIRPLRSTLAGFTEQEVLALPGRDSEREAWLALNSASISEVWTLVETCTGVSEVQLIATHSLFFRATWVGEDRGFGLSVVFYGVNRTCQGPVEIGISLPQWSGFVAESWRTR